MEVNVQQFKLNTLNISNQQPVNLKITKKAFVKDGNLILKERHSLLN